MYMLCTCSFCQRLPAGSFRYLIALIDPAGGVFPESLGGGGGESNEKPIFLNQTKFKKKKREVECTVHVLLSTVLWTPSRFVALVKNGGSR